jgi:acetyltransferase-like isoleucine patch superfamily enzyme
MLSILKRIIRIRKARLKYKYYILIHKKRGIVIHPTVKIDRRVEMYTGSPFWDNLNGRIVLAENVMLGKGFTIHCYGGIVNIGLNTIFGPNVVIYGHGNVTVGKNCLIAMECKIIASNHQIPSASINIIDVPDINKPVVIGNDVWLGANVIVLAGITIGDGCVVGAGSVVTKNLEPYSIAVGNPAKIIRKRI